MGCMIAVGIGGVLMAGLLFGPVGFFGALALVAVVVVVGVVAGIADPEGRKPIEEQRTETLWGAVAHGRRALRSARKRLDHEAAASAEEALDRLYGELRSRGEHVEEG